MGRSIFGWDLPPGCTMRDIENAFGEESPCLICGRFSDDCLCPECPKCFNFGDPKCYKEHGLVITDEQILGQRQIMLEEVLQKELDEELYKAHMEDNLDA